MRTTEVNRRVRWRQAFAATLVLALGGCSSLQIDVDVYKGPLANNEEMQRDQLVSMSMSAKTMMYTVRNQLLDEVASNWEACSSALEGVLEKRRRPLIAEEWQFLGEDGLCTAGAPTEVKDMAASRSAYEKGAAWTTRPMPTDQPRVKRNSVVGAAPEMGSRAETDAQRSLRNARLLNAVLRFYEPSRVGTPFYDPFDSGRTPEGIDMLATQYAASRDEAALDGSSTSITSGSAIGSASPIATSKKVIATNQFSRLRHVLIDMAARMHFLATNQWLVDGADSKGTRLGKFKALLESVANGIIVHADDLQRNEQFEARQNSKESIESERRGAQSAFATTAAASLKSLLSAMEEGRKAAVEAEKKESDGLGEQRSAEAGRKTKQALGEAALADAEAKAGVAADGAALLATMAPRLVAKKAGPGDEAPAAIATDVAAVSALLQGKGEPVSLDGLRASLQRWLSVEAKVYEPTGLNNQLRGLRLRAALRYLDGQLPQMGEPTALIDKRAEAVKTFRELVVSAVADAAQSASRSNELHRQAKADLLVATNAVAQASPKPGARARTGLTPLQWAQAVEKLEELKAAALSQAAASHANADMALLSSVFMQLIQAERAKPNAPVAALDNAMAALRETPAPSSMNAPPESPAQVVQVLDDVIAQLRYRHIDSIRRLGENSSESRQVLAALDAARRQREDLVFLRPASTYLRSAYAATALQADPLLGARNLLLANATRTLRGFFDSDGAFGSAESKYAATRAELDKTYWQSINAVRLNAAGSSNFVIAKDDVGNWYVKAMGSDPGAMIRTAKQLALFNMGSAFDTNLLRVGELRDRIDDRNTDSEARAAAKSELDGLTESTSGPSVAARSETLSLFRQNYEKLSQEHRKSLATRLEADAFNVSLKARWATTLKLARQPSVLDPLPELPAMADLHKSARDTATATPVDDKASGKTVVAVLEILHRLRSALKSAVQAAPGLTDDDQLQVTRAQKEVDSQQVLVDTAAGEEQKAGEELARTGTALAEARLKTDTPLLKAAQEAFDAAGRVRGEKVAAKLTADKLLATRRAALATAEAALTAARDRRDRAVADVDTVYRTAIDDVVEQRLRVVQETETAVKIIGRHAK